MVRAMIFMTLKVVWGYKIFRRVSSIYEVRKRFKVA